MAVPGDRKPESPARAEKRLARGLEDVSHIFLSPSASGAPSPEAAPRTPDEPVPAARPSRSEPVLLTEGAEISEDHLITFLHSNTGVLEEGLRAIDKGIPCGEFGPIGLMAVDAANQLVLVDVATSPGDQLLLRGICHFDWIVRNIPVARRMYHGRIIDFSAQPRLFLVAPRFSTMLLCAATRIPHPRVACFRYHVVTAPEGAGVFLERA